MSRQPTSATAKLTSEVDFFTVQFALLPGETIASVTQTIALSWGADASPSAMLVSSGAISGDRVTFALQSGVAGNIYEVAVTATTSNGRILVNKLLLEVCS